MRNRAALLVLIALAGCAKRQENADDRTRPSRSYDVQETTESAPGEGPGVSVTAAPGVAFHYRYAYRLPNLKIGSVQERHAQMCERLGVARCRITGMRYTLERNADVSATLDLKLDPAIARTFGKAATQAVTEADGVLANQEITGEDVGTGIAAARRNEAEISADIARIDRQLAQPGLSAGTREQLIAQAAQLREELRGTRGQRGDAEEALARTPMHFDYDTGAPVPVLRHAVEQAGDTALNALAFLIVLVGALLPWGVVGLILFGLWRWLAPTWRRRFPPRHADGEP